MVKNTAFRRNLPAGGRCSLQLDKNESENDSESNEESEEDDGEEYYSDSELSLEEYDE